MCYMRQGWPGEKPAACKAGAGASFGAEHLEGGRGWGHVDGMVRKPPTIDMLPDGSFREPRRGNTVPFSAKLMVAAVLVTALSVSVAVAAFAIWVVSLVLPVIIIWGAVIWGTMKYRRWQSVRNRDGYVVPPRYPAATGLKRTIANE